MNEDAQKANKFMLNESVEIEKLLNKMAKDSLGYDNTHKEKGEAKFMLYYSLVCPHCKAKVQLKPLGEIKQEDYLLYFRFQCNKCKKEFSPEKPNNDGDLLVWYKNLLEDINDPKKAIIRNGSPKIFKDSEVRNFKKLFNDLKEDVNRKNGLDINVDVAGNAFIEHLHTSNHWYETARQDLSDGLNVFGLQPKSYFKDSTNVLDAEKELYDLLHSLKISSQNNKNNNDLEDDELNDTMEYLRTTEENLNSNIKNRENYLNELEEYRNTVWNEVHTTNCVKCNKQIISKPIGEMRALNGRVHFFFLCDVCTQRFAEKLPNSIPDMVTHTEELLKTSFNNPITSAISRKQFGVSKSDVSIMRQHLEQMKKESAELKKNELVINESFANHDKWVRESIETLKSLRE
jgi:rubredoxin